MTCSDASHPFKAPARLILDSTISELGQRAALALALEVSDPEGAIWMRHDRGDRF